MEVWQTRQASDVRIINDLLLEPITRRRALRRGAVATATLASLSLLDAAPALADAGAQPKPIPGGFDKSFNLVAKNPFVHVMPPQIGVEMSTITDFQGGIAAAEIQGTAHGSNGKSFTFDADMRFMHGTYVGRDGRRRVGAFGFV